MNLQSLSMGNVRTGLDQPGVKKDRWSKPWWFLLQFFVQPFSSSVCGHTSCMNARQAAARCSSSACSALLSFTRRVSPTSFHTSLGPGTRGLSSVMAPTTAAAGTIIFLLPRAATGELASEDMGDWWPWSFSCSESEAGEWAVSGAMCSLLEVSTRRPLPAS